MPFTSPEILALNWNTLTSWVSSPAAAVLEVLVQECLSMATWGPEWIQSVYSNSYRITTSLCPH